MESLNRDIYKKFNYAQLNKNLVVKYRPKRPRFFRP